MAGGPTVGIRFQGDDYVSPTVKSIKGSVDGLGVSAKSSILTGFGLGAGVAAFGLVKSAIGAVLGPLGDAWQLSKDTQVAQVLLAQALKNNVPNWNGNAKGADDFALAQGRLGFHSNDVRDALAQLVGVTHDVGLAQKDVALAEDLARSKGIDLATATDIVTKASLGNGKALKSLGIDTRGAVTAAQLLDAVQKNVTTTAEQWAKTSEGRAAVAQVKLTEVMTKVGNVIDHVAQAVIPVAAGAVLFLLDNFTKLLPGIIAVAGGITALLIPSLVGMAVAAWAAMAPLLPVIAALALLGIGAMGVASAFDASTQKVRDAEPHWRHFGHTVTDTLATIPAAATTAMQDTSAALREGGSSVANAAQDNIANPIWQAAYDAKAKAQAEAAKIPGAMADAMLANDKALIDSSATLANVINNSLTAGQERSSAIGFLTSQVYADALASGKPAAIAKAAELANAALVVLWGATASGAAAGSGVGNAWVNGLNAALAAGYSGQTYTWIQKYEKLLKFAGSPDYTKAIRAGTGVAKGWLSGFNNGMGAGKVNLPSLSGASGGMTMAGAGGGGGGSEVHIHIDQGAYIDGPSIDMLATKITQRLNLAGVN